MKDMEVVLLRQGRVSDGNDRTRAMAHHLKKEDGRRLLGGNEAMDWTKARYWFPYNDVKVTSWLAGYEPVLSRARREGHGNTTAGSPQIQGRHRVYPILLSHWPVLWLATQKSLAMVTQATQGVQRTCMTM